MSYRSSWTLCVLSVGEQGFRILQAVGLRLEAVVPLKTPTWRTCEPKGTQRLHVAAQNMYIYIYIYIYIYTRTGAFQGLPCHNFGPM